MDAENRIARFRIRISLHLDDLAVLADSGYARRLGLWPRL